MQTQSAALGDTARSRNYLEICRSDFLSDGLSRRSVADYIGSCVAIICARRVHVRKVGQK